MHMFFQNIVGFFPVHKYVSNSHVSCKLASQTRKDKEVLCSPPTVPAFWESFESLDLEQWA